MGTIPSETIEQIAAANDIVEVIGSYFPLKRAGANLFASPWDQRGNRETLATWLRPRRVGCVRQLGARPGLCYRRADREWTRQNERRGRTDRISAIGKRVQDSAGHCRI